MATPTLTRHQLAGALGPILVDVRTSDRSQPRPAVLVIHGFKGFKDWGMFPALSERIARAGFTAVSFNLSGSGVDDRGDFVFPERFGHNTYSAELADIATVADALADGSLGTAPTSRLGLVGHSRGGGMAILTAARDPRVQALVTWAAISAPQRWADQLDAWREKGKIEVANARTGQVLPIYRDLLEDIEQHGPELDIQQAAHLVKIPWLLLHGEGDAAVAVAEGRLLAANADPAHVRAMFFPETGHTFGAVHPYAGLNPDLAQVFDETVKWLGRWL